MDPMIFVWLVMAALLAVVFVGLWWSESIETRRWADWAGRRGWRFHKAWPELLVSLRGGPTGQGHSRSVSRAYEGRLRGAQVRGGRYSYTVGYGKSSRTFISGINGVRVPGACFSPTTLRRNRGLSRAVTTKGERQYENVDFNRMWEVIGHDAKQASDLVHPRLMERLLKAPADIEMVWFDGEYVWVGSKHAVEVTSVVDRHLGLAMTVAQLLPAWLVNEHGADRLQLTAAGPEPLVVAPELASDPVRQDEGHGDLQPRRG